MKKKKQEALIKRMQGFYNDIEDSKAVAHLAITTIKEVASKKVFKDVFISMDGEGDEDHSPNLFSLDYQVGNVFIAIQSIWLPKKNTCIISAHTYDTKKLLGGVSAEGLTKKSAKNFLLTIFEACEKENTAMGVLLG